MRCALIVLASVLLWLPMQAVRTWCTNARSTGCRCLSASARFCQWHRKWSAATRNLWTPLTLEVYSGARAEEFNLYEDDGVSPGYGKGACAWTPLRFSQERADTYTLSIGPAEGKFPGQLGKRRYVVHVHGLFKPERVTIEGRKLAETEDCQGAAGWSWNEREHLITMNLPKPLSVHQETVVQFSNAGTLADLSTWQKAWNLRAQVRQAKRDMKLKHAALVAGLGIRKPPRVIRETEEVERLLSDIIDRPKGCGQAPPDVAGLQPQRVLAALTHEPFESNRTLPGPDPESRQGMEATKGAKFSADELQSITNRFRGPDLPAWLWSAK